MHGRSILAADNPRTRNAAARPSPTARVLLALGVALLTSGLAPLTAVAQTSHDAYDAAGAGDLAPEVPALAPAELELAALLEKRAAVAVSDLTVGDLATALELASIAAQQRAHIEQSAALSWFVPGLGHSINGERSTAFAFAAADVAIGLATAVVAYAVLPPAVKYANLNYLQSPLETIEARWKTITPASLIPSVSVAAAGALLQLTLRSVAAQSARDAAWRAVAAGVVTFEPVPLNLPTGATLR